MTIRYIAYILLLLSCSVFIAAGHASADTKKKLREKADSKKGEGIYLKMCAFCHSESGDGKNWVGLFIEPHPRNFTDWKVMKDISRERMFTSILNGRPGTAMPTWKGLLSEDDIRDVIVYIEKKFIKKGLKNN